MDSAENATVLARIEEPWSPLHSAITSLNAAALESATNAGWTAKESVAHLAFWDEAAYGFMLLTYFDEPLPDGWTFGSGWLPGEEPWPHFEVHNAREAAWARSQPVGAVLERLERAHAQLLGILPRLTPELIREKRDHLNEVSQHYVNHLPEFETLARTKPA